MKTKDFDRWCDKKSELIGNDKIKYYHIREIWWCYLGINIGKVDGKRAKANLSQIRVIDTKRLLSKITMLEKDIFLKKKKSAKDLF